MPQAIHPVYPLVVSRPPMAPFTGVQFKSTQTTTTDETTSTFNSLDIGTPHVDRLVIVSMFFGINALPTSMSLNGYAPVHLTVLNEFGIAAFRIQTGLTGSFVLSVTGSTRKAIGIYVAYPANPIAMDFGSATANTTANANIADLKAQHNGCLVYSGGQLAVLGTFTTTWNGGNGTLVENADAQLEGVSSYTHGHINFTASADTGDLDLAESVSGTKRLIAATWGPARGY